MRKIFLFILLSLMVLSSCGIKKSTIIVPDIRETEEQTGENVLSSIGLVPLVIEEFSDVIEQGKIIRTDPKEKTEVDSGSKVTMFVSQGMEIVNVKDGNWYAWYVEGSQEDEYQFLSGHIEGNELILKMRVVYNSVYPMTWENVALNNYGYGNASTNDSFSEKVVPIKVYYDDFVITKGSPQNIVLRIPLEGLGTNRPVKVYTQLAASINGNFEYIKIEFTFNW